VTATVDIDHRPRLLATLVRALGRASAQYTAFSQALAAQLGIGATDMECLALLQDFGPASAGQLADALSLTTGAITGVVDRLEAAGFVVREADPSDRRRVIVRAVAKRMQDVERAFAPLLQAAAQSLALYTERDLDELIDFEHRAFKLMQQQTARLKAERAPSDLGPLLTAPLGAVSEASLEFANGASELRIAASESATQLYQAAFEGPQPSVRVQDGSVTFRYKRMGLFDWAKHSGTVSLAATIPWTIALRGGVANATVDARGLVLRELSIGGGASKLDCLLPAPRGTVRVCVDSGVNRVKIERPDDVPVQIIIHGGANRLEFDGQRFGAIGGDVRLASTGWELAGDRYAIEVRGGASRLEINETQEVN
jgi:DNA-binding MarR family transcriptional regulator